MKSRLFWKILLGVWAMLLTMSLAVVLGQYLYFINQRATYLAFDDWNNERFVSLMAAVLRTGGRSALDDFLKIWGQATGDRLSVRAISPAQMFPTDRTPHHVKPTVADALLAHQPWTVVVSSPDGTWQLIYTPQFWEPHVVYMLRDFVRTRTPEFILEMLVSLAFSALLAWYLTRPIQRLRIGFERLARGDLRARLHAQTWGRRDEISDLARDFDHVAERLEQLVVARDQLLHDVSHALRTPLARLRLSIDLAKQADSAPSGTGQAAPGDAVTSHSLTRIDAECHRIDRLVGELLTLSRAESDITGNDEYFDVPELVRAVVEDAELEARHVGVTMQVKSHSADLAGTRWAVGDAELLRRGLENILRNALRHSPLGRSVEIVVRLRHGPGGGADGELNGYDIEISDQGPGVADAALEKIFDPFVRLPGESSEGFGLGLAIARRAVHTNGGAVRALNRVGGGLTVLISIPAAAALPDSALAPLGRA
jgi:two-component system, OmpR family, sensor kinase